MIAHRFFLIGITAVVVSILSEGSASAQANAKVPDPDPELERRTFVLPPGLEVQLFAADPMLAKPIQMNFDAQGRLWVATSETYPQVRPGEKANDKIIILEDSDGDGKADKTQVFADGLLMPTGVLPGDGGAYVANSTELLHLSASRPGGKADRVRVLLSGFGTEDTHHILHTFRWGPDGSLFFHQSIYIHSHVETPYGVQRLNAGGAWRFRPATGELEVFLRGFINPWGHAFDRYGRSFLTDGANGEGITPGVPGAYYPTAQGPHAQRTLHGLNPGSPKHCGLEIISGRHFPEDWQGDLITCDFRGHRVCRFKISENGSTFTSREMPEVIKSTHPAFRPVDVKMGPDGALYIADWYNPIIQHGEVDFRDPRRDKTHGRIWRVTVSSRPLVPRPQLVEQNVAQLIGRLSEPEQWTRDQARRLLWERGPQAVLPSLVEHAQQLNPQAPDYPQLLLEYLWLFHGFGLYRHTATPPQLLPTYQPIATQLLQKALTVAHPPVRAAAVRIVGESSLPTQQRLLWLEQAVTDASAGVRLEAVRALARLPHPQAVTTALLALDRPLDPVLDYALWLTVRELAPQWLPAFQSGQLTFAGKTAHLSYALQAVGSREVVGPLRQLLTQKRDDPQQADDLLTLLIQIGEPADLARALHIAAELVRTQPDPQSPARIRAARIVRQVEQAAATRKIPLPPEMATTLSELLPLANEEPALYRLIGYGQFQSLRPVLRRITLSALPAERLPADAPRLEPSDATAASSPTVLRASLEGLAMFGDESARQDLRRVAQHGRTPASRVGAIVALSRLAPGEAATWLVSLAQHHPSPPELVEAFAALLQLRTGSSALTKSLQGTTITPEAARLGLQAIRNSGQDLPTLREALRRAGGLDRPRTPPTPEQIQTLAQEAAQRGNPARGERLFRLPELQCFACHAISGAGGQVGPDLSSIGASAPVDYLVEALLLPNKAVKEGYHAQRIVTTDDKVFLGIPIREADGRLFLRTAEDKVISLPLADIAERTHAPSLMPEGLTDSLSQQELIDLVAFLSQLGKVGTPYAPSVEPLIRRWEALEATPNNLQLLRRQRVALASQPDNTLTWKPVFTLVRGDLPLEDLPQFAVWQGTAPQSVVRTRLWVTTAGRLLLRCHDVTGLTLYLQGQPVPLQAETTLELPHGLISLTFIIDRSQRQTPLRVELHTPTTQAAHWNFATGTVQR
jgi:putative heme-binding domain-containing protein